MPDSYIERILKARVYEVTQEPPLTLAAALSARLGNQLLLKRALITNPPKAGRPMWVCARKSIFCKGAATPGLNKVGGIMIKALKQEDLQLVFSFKLRGAYNKLVSLSPQVWARGGHRGQRR